MIQVYHLLRQDRNSFIKRYTCVFRESLTAGVVAVICAMELGSSAIGREGLKRKSRCNNSMELKMDQVSSFQVSNLKNRWVAIK